MAEIQEGFELLLAVICTNSETLDFQNASIQLGFAGTPSLPAHKQAQRKFKKIVEASGKYKLEKGKVIPSGEATAAVPATPKPTSKSAFPVTPASTGKKRGRPAKATASASKKRMKLVAKEKSNDGAEDGDTVEEEEEKSAAAGDAEDEGNEYD